MRLTARAGIVIAIVAVAIAAALPFRRPVRPTTETVAGTGSMIERRLQTNGPDRWSRPSHSTPLQTKPLRVPTASTGMDPETASGAPDLPASYHRTFSPVGALLNPLDEPADENAVSLDEPQLLRPQWDQGGLRALTHKISDGDTLSALAQEFLGDAALQNELFEYNRDVLKNPDLLPIGQVIKIPPREKAVEPAQPKIEPIPALAPIPRGAFGGE